MENSDKTTKNIIDFVNSIPFEPEKYNQEKKRKYFHNLYYYEIDYDVDKLNEANSSLYQRYLKQEIKNTIRENIICNLNDLFKYVGFTKRFESLPTDQDYENIKHFSKFINIFDLGLLFSADNTFREIVEEIYNLVNYLDPNKEPEFREDLISKETLALKKEDFQKIIQILEDYKNESEELKKYSNWYQIYQAYN